MSAGVGVEIVDFEVRSAEIDGVLVVTPKQVTDGRGTIRELFRRSAFEAAGISLDAFQQINVTESHQGVIRGMHAEQMTKLLTVAAGAAFGAYVDLRRTSPTFGRVVTVELRPGVQVLVPAGVANGFQALTDGCQYVYCFDAEWQPGMAGDACSPVGIGVDWPIPVASGDTDLISAKDLAAPTLDEIRREETTT